MTAKEHYDRHLGNFYSWMVGDFAEKQRMQQMYFTENGIKPVLNALAFDLGCGHGLQTIALANLGFSVTAIDFNQQLLNDLKGKVENLSIECIELDLLKFLKETTVQPELVVCMGDTLTHLESLKDVEEMISLSAQKLLSGGKLVLSYRTLDSDLIDEKRFIPVRSDEKRIHTCFLEYTKDYVKVFDILHEKEDEVWTQHVSWYPKLRVSLPFILSILSKNFLTVKSQQMIAGMVYLIAGKIDKPTQ